MCDDHRPPADEPPPGSLFARCRTIAESDPFEGTIATLLILNATVIGWESAADIGAYDVALWNFFVVSQATFIVEIAVRVASYGPRVGAFFRDGWNVFDFTVVALSLVPTVGPLSYLARLVRVLRVLRIVSFAAGRSRRSPS